jgi:hypothetical protein
MPNIAVRNESVDAKVFVEVVCQHKETEEQVDGLTSTIYCSNVACWFNTEPLNVVAHGEMGE